VLCRTASSGCSNVKQLSNTNFSNEDSNNHMRLDSSVGRSSSILTLKASPLPFKLRDDSTKSSNRYLFPNMVVNDSVGRRDDGGYKMMSQSYGGDSTPLLSGMMRGNALPSSVQR
jgi:hypothetical protein